MASVRAMMGASRLASRSSPAALSLARSGSSVSNSAWPTGPSGTTPGHNRRTTADAPAVASRGVVEGSVVGRRSLSTAVASALEKMDSQQKAPSAASIGSAPRTIPTRHSRTLPPPVCSHRTLRSLTASLLESPPGSMFSYPQNDASILLSLEEELDRAAERSDPIRQKFEYCLRGHSALIEGSFVDRELGRERPGRYGSDEDWGEGVALAGAVPGEGTEDHERWEALRAYRGGDGAPEGALHPLERVEIMERLIDRIETEGKLYAEMRSRLKSQVARVGESGSSSEDVFGSDSDSSSSSSSDSSDSDFSDSEVEYTSSASSATAWRADQLGAEFGSPPGPSTSMYDLLLDGVAVTAPLTPLSPDASPDDTFVPQRAIDVHHRILNRHNADGGQDNVNPESVPTHLSYNAVIRAALDTPYDPRDDKTCDRSRMTRDMIIDAAFRTYDAIYRSDMADRNSATYVYMLGIVAKCFPPSRSRGNIAYGLFVKAREEQVVNRDVIRAFGEAMEPSNGKEFDEYMTDMEERLGKATGGKLPYKWTRHSEAKMHKKWDCGY